MQNIRAILKEGQAMSKKELRKQIGLPKVSFGFKIDRANIYGLELNPNMNPDFESGSPEEGWVLVAKGRWSEWVAERLRGSIREYPIWVERGSKVAECGIYKVGDWTDDPNKLAALSEKASFIKDEIVCAIKLEKVH